MTSAQTAARLRVFLADDHPVVLSGIKALVASDAGLELVGEATDGTTALRAAVAQRPDVAVLDLSMPGLDGVEVARRLRAACPQCRILVLTVHDDGVYVRKLLEIGVAGYLLKRSAGEELLRGIHAIAAGGIYVDSAIAECREGGATDPVPVDAPQEQAGDLSAREIEVLRLAAVGHSNKMVAAKLNIGVRSVETYKARAMEKLGFHSRVEVVRFAIGKGWLGET